MDKYSLIYIIVERKVRVQLVISYGPSIQLEPKSIRCRGSLKI